MIGLEQTISSFQSTATKSLHTLIHRHNNYFIGSHRVGAFFFRIRIRVHHRSLLGGAVHLGGGGEINYLLRWQIGLLTSFAVGKLCGQIGDCVHTTTLKREDTCMVAAQ